MKQIENYNANKYCNDLYSESEYGVYEVKEDGESLYVTSLSFVQEPEFNEGANASDITQYPLEDIRNLRSLIGKHVYNKEIEGYIKLIIE